MTQIVTTNLQKMSNNTYTFNNTATCVSYYGFNIPQPQRLIIGITHAILCPITVVCNGVLIYAHQKTGQFDTVSNKLILVMSLSDMFLGLACQPFAALAITVNKLNRRCIFKKIIEFMAFLPAHFSGYILFCITLDRFVHVTKLNHYASYMTDFRMKIMTFVSFAMAFSFISANTLHPSFLLHILETAASDVILIMTAIMDLLILRKLRLLKSNLRKTLGNDLFVIPQVGAVKFKLDAKPDHVQRSFQTCSPNKREFSKAQLSAIKTTQLLLAALLILYGPYHVVSIIWAYYKFDQMTNPGITLDLLMYCSYILVQSNAWVNALIIVYGNRRCLQFVRSCFRGNRVTFEGS